MLRDALCSASARIARGAMLSGMQRQAIKVWLIAILVALRT